MMVEVLVAVGDRVVAFYGHRTHGLLPETRVIRVPQDITLKIEPLQGFTKVRHLSCPTRSLQHLTTPLQHIFNTSPTPLNTLGETPTLRSLMT